MLEGIAASVRVSRLTGLCDKQDVWDWVVCRRASEKDEEIRKQFLREVNSTPCYRRK
jgi:hypothetical protein